MRFPRTIRLDSSDLQVFHKAAAPGEWALPGGFVFARRDPSSLDSKDRQAFSHGWLGCESFGHSTLVEVAEIEEADFFRLVERLARHFVEAYGAPDLGAALPVARQEADDAASLCEHPLHSLLALAREWDEAGIRESFRVIQPERARDHAKIWDFVEEPSGET